MRSIFLERILKSIVGSIDNLLDGLGDRVDDIKDDLASMDAQLDSVKDKIDLAISAIGSNLSSVYIKADDTAQNNLLVNQNEITIPKVNSATQTIAKFKSYANGQFYTFMIYDEGRSSHENPGTTRQAYIEYRITREGVAGDWTPLHQLYTVGVSATPEENKRSENKTIDIQSDDILEFRYWSGTNYGDNPKTAVLKSLYINYSLTSIADENGAFQPQSLEAKKLEPIEPEEEQEEEPEEEPEEEAPEEGEE